MKCSVKSFFMAIVVIALAAISCNKESADMADSKFDKHTCEMKLVGSLTEFDYIKTKSGSDASEWKDGSIIYLRMDSPLGITTGEAVYNSSTDVWTISYYGSLYEGGAQSCSALYLEDKVSYESSVFTMNEGTVIYEDIEGSYIFEEGDLVVTANLKPKTGRIRFSGEPGKVLKIYGVTYYSKYNIDSDIFYTENKTFKLTVGEDGYTPYFYGFFTDSESPNIKVWIDAKEAYTRYFSDGIFNPGQSGKLTLPTADKHNGWAIGLYFNVMGAQFKMVAVEGSTFVMGDPESTDAAYTAHNVTLTGYCIGETEITKNIYCNLHEMSITNSGKNKPLWLTFNDFITFITDLNTYCGADFTLLTEAQWEFAAKGGIHSKGYTYSGSNSIEDVAWYHDGTFIDEQDVKLKLPNELGLYDMTGNILEWTLDYYTGYSSASVTDPYVTSNNGERHCVRGGSVGRASSSCTNIFRDNYYSETGGIGSRFALNWN